MSLLPPECPKCGASHWRHEVCPVKSQSKAIIVPKEVYEFPVTTPESVPKRPKEPVTTVTTPVTTQRKSSQKEIDKVKAWREANREKYNGYMRGQRAKKRGTK